MEQYEISRTSYFKIIQSILAKFKPEAIFVRLVGSKGGGVVVDEDLTDKILVFKKSKGGFKVFVDNQEKFFYETNNRRFHGRSWSIAYFRTHEDGRWHVASTGYPNFQEPQYNGPDDPKLPSIKKTILRSANFDYLIEITFPVKIPIRNTGKLVNQIPGWYYHEPVL